MTEQKNTDINGQNGSDNVAEEELRRAAEASADVPSAETEDETAQQGDTEGGVVDELAAAQEEIAKLKDAFLRAKAEEDNVRRRAEKEVANGRKFAVEAFAKEMITVRDSLKLAVAVDVADDADDAIKNIHEGVHLTLKQLDSALSKFSLKEIAPEVGDKLDPNLHQAMSMIESDEVDPGCIINVIQAGFELHDRLLRPAMVVVAK